MRIHNFVFDKTIVNTMFVSLGIHLFYFSCIVFTFEDKIRYSLEPPNIDFLGSILKGSDILTEGEAARGSFIIKISDKFLNAPRQDAKLGQSYPSVSKPSFLRKGLSVGQKLPTKFIGTPSGYGVEKKADNGNTQDSDSVYDWGTNLKLKSNDKN
ncbi:MAG: hypothetical protein FJZ10_05935 [Candidatus Omnitrophica bacterium]|nr:hypothetical protein [Candidatus Omnitrophota bacterium]